MGRLVGQVAFLAHCTGGHEPGVFAVVGAAAFAGGATRAISTAVIVAEITGQAHLLLPISIGVIAAYFAANRIAKPAYDCLLQANAFALIFQR